MKNRFILLSIAFIAVFQPVDAITIAASSNLQYVMEELKTSFEKKTGTRIKISYGSSGQLTTQIRNGAPFHLFLSADTMYAERLFAEGYATEPPKLYAFGSLVLWTMKALDLSRWQEVLLDSKIKKIAVANPDVAPYGAEAIQVLKYYKLLQRLRHKLVYGQSIGQVNSFITTGAADIGFTSKSAVMAPQMKGKGVYIEIDPRVYDLISQAMIVLKSDAKEKAAAFSQFLLTAEARRIFERHGYLYE